MSESIGKPKDYYETLTTIKQSIKLFKTKNIVSQGVLKKVKHRVTEKIRTMKIIKKDLIEAEEDETLLFKQLGLLRSIDHPCVIKIYDFYKDEKYFYLISEYLIF